VAEHALVLAGLRYLPERARALLRQPAAQTRLRAEPVTGAVKMVTSSHQGEALASARPCPGIFS
jgi:hypothetical protein